MRGKPPIPFETRFMEDPETGCLEWQGAKNPRGYGHFKLNGRWHYAHRHAWELAYGPIPKGIEVCHHCDNVACGNVDHLFLGTHVDNMQDAAAKGRGGRIPWKLSDAQVASIREDDRPAMALAVEYAVARTYIDRIRSGARRAVARQEGFDL